MPDTFQSVNGSPFHLQQDIPGIARNRDGNYNVGIDRHEWDALFMRLTGAAPGQATEASANAALDPAVSRAASRTKRMVAADTPELTGRMKASWEKEREAPGLYAVKNEVVDEKGTSYASLVEARAAGGPAKYHGAMIAQNIGRIEAALVEEVEKQILDATAGAAAFQQATDALDAGDAALAGTIWRSVAPRARRAFQRVNRYRGTR